MGTEWIDDLRVVDLKEELKNRDLPVSGKKAELAARLRAAVESKAQEGESSKAGDAEAASEPASKAEEQAAGKANQAASPEDENEADKAGETDVRAAARPAKVTDDHEQQAVEGKGTEGAGPGAATPAAEPSGAAAGAAQAAGDQHIAAEKSPEPGDTLLEKPAKVSGAALTTNERHEAEPVPAIDEGPAAQAEVAAEEPVSATPLPEERLPSMQAALLAPQPTGTEAVQDAEMEAVDFEADDVEEPAAASAAAKGDQSGPGVSAKKQRQSLEAADDRDAKRQKLQESDLPRSDSGRQKREPIPIFRPRDKSASARASEESERLDSADGKRPSVFDRIGALGSEERRVSATGAPPTRIKPTRALLVTGFIRPFTVTAARNLFATYGEIEGMWMPQIRDKAYILFKEEDAAEAARQGTHGLEWPHGNRTSLRPKFVSVEEAEKMISGEGKEPGTPPAGPVSEGGTPQAVAAPASAAAAKGTVKMPGPEPTPKSSEPAKEEVQEKTLEDLFRKTDTGPHLYWLPLTEAQVAEKQKSNREQKTREARGRM